MKTSTNRHSHTRVVAIIFIGMLVSACSDGSGWSAEPEFNVRVFAINAEGRPVNFDVIDWGYGSRTAPEGEVRVECAFYQTDEGPPCPAAYLDIGFEAQGDIWFRAYQQHYLHGYCFDHRYIDSRVVANPSKEQEITVQFILGAGSCIPFLDRERH